MLWVSVLNDVKIVLVFSILIVFVIKPLVVSFYQQRSGDYFSNKLLYWYSKMEMYEAAMSGRRKVMLTANWLNTLLWALSFLLLLVVTLEGFMFK